MFHGIQKTFHLQRFFVGEGPQNPPYFLNQRRVFILPTKQGLGFALLLLIMLLGSSNYNNGLGYFLTFLLCGLFVVAMFHTYNNLLHLSIGPAITAPIFANAAGGFTVQIDNSNYRQRCSIQVFVPNNQRHTVDCEAHGLATWLISYRFSRRGWFPLPRFTLETTYPLGLFRAWANIELDQRQLVYPEPLANALLPTEQRGAVAGNLQVEKGDDDFRNLRAYVPGDPLQHVHWKNYARHQSMQTKEFSAAMAKGLWLDWKDTTVYGTEQKISQLTRWVVLANEDNKPFGLRLPATTIQPGSGAKHYHSCLKQLALFDDVGG